jgi:hypothetical protein
MGLKKTTGSSSSSAAGGLARKAMKAREEEERWSKYEAGGTFELGLGQEELRRVY